MKQSIGKHNLTEGPLIPVLIRFSIPIVLANLLHTTYNMVDTLVVGRMLGSNALSAVAIGADVMLLINLACNGLCSGAQILIGQHVGAKENEALNKCVGTLISVFLLMALCLTVVMLCVASPLLRLLNTPEAVWDQTLGYSVVCFCGLVGIFGYNALGAIMRGMGDSKSPLLFVGVASGANLVLDVLLVPLIGVVGAALATVLAQAGSFVWALIYLYRERVRFGFDFKRESFIPDRKITLRFFRVGLPMGLQNALMQSATLFVNSFVFSYGVAATAINGIGNKISSVAIIVTNSLVRSGSTMVAQNIAARKVDRVKKVYFFNAVCAGTFSLLLSAAVILFPKEIFGLFVKDDAVIALIPSYLAVVVLKLCSYAVRSPNVALINGIGKPKLNLIIGVLDGFVLRVGISMLLGMVLGMGLPGYWYGLALGGYSPMLIGLPYFLSGKWKREKLVIEK